MPAGTVERQFEYYKLEPWGDESELISAATSVIVTTIQAIAAGFSGEGAEPPPPIPHDFLLPYRKHKDEEAEQIEVGLKALEGLRDI